MWLCPAATINFSRLGARAFISKTAKTSAKVYFKSTVAGLHPDEQAAGRRVPVTTSAPAAPAAAGAGSVPGLAAAGSSGQAYAARSDGASLYPPGPAAAAAAAAVGAARVGAAPVYPAK